MGRGRGRAGRRGFKEIVKICERRLRLGNPNDPQIVFKLIIICFKGEVMFINFGKHFKLTAEKNLYKNNTFIIVLIISISEKFHF